MLQQQIWRTTNDERARQIDRSTGLRAEAFKHTMAMLLAGVQRSYRRQVARRRAHLAMLELSAFEDRMLRDIGVDRADIPKLTRDLVEKGGERGAQSAPREPGRARAPDTARQAVSEPAVACCA